MKKIFLLSCLFLSATSFAQDYPWFIGGGLSANYAASNVTTSIKSQSNWELNPEIGRNIYERIQIGGNLTIGENKTIYTGGGSNTSPELGIGAFGRYMFGDLAFKPFVGVKVGYITSGTGWSGFSSAASITTAHINAGFAYTMAPRWTVFGSYGMAGYVRSKTNASSEAVMNSFGVNLSTLGNRFVIGMYYNFGKSKE